MNLLRRFPITSYVAGTYLWTWTFWLSLSFSSISPFSRLFRALFIVGLSGPFVVSAILAFANGGKKEVLKLWKKALVWRISPAWFVLALILPPVLMLTGTALARLFFHDAPIIPLPALIAVSTVLLWTVFFDGPTSEEFGWRGFLLPRLLERYNPLSASLILAPIWAFWHVPLWHWALHRDWPFTLFFLMVLAMTFLFTWFFLHTQGSLLVAILFHAAVNTFIRFIPVLPPAYVSLRPFELWVASAGLLVLVLLYVDRKRWFAAARTSASATPIPDPPLGPKPAPPNLIFKPH